MPDFPAPPRGDMTPAEYACAYLVQRVRCDADFRWYMLHTRGLSLCLEALAPLLGPVVEQEARLTASLRDKRDPDVVTFRERASALEDEISASTTDKAFHEAWDDASSLRDVLRVIHEHLAAGETLAGDQWLPSCQATTILREIERVL